MISCGTSSNFETLTLLKRKKFCRFPHRHGEGRGNPETQNETCWSIKTSISWEAFFNFDTLTLSKRKTRNMKRDMLEHQSEHFMRDVLQVWHVDTIKKKGFTCGLVHLNLATLEPKKKSQKCPGGDGGPHFGDPNLTLGSQTSTESGTYQTCSHMFPLHYRDTQPHVSCCTFVIIKPCSLYKVENLSWAYMRAEWVLGINQGPRNTRGLLWKNLGLSQKTQNH